jgi:hypothetical protein
MCTAAPNLNLNPEEKRAYGLLFRQADTDNVGVVTGDVAVKFFEKTRLDSRILGEVGFFSYPLLELLSVVRAYSAFSLGESADTGVEPTRYGK